MRWIQGFGFNSKLVRLKAGKIASGVRPRLLFQFQTGAIKSPAYSSGLECQGPFQFQTGAIKRRDSYNQPVSGVPRFNSKLVRLKGTRIFQNPNAGMFQFQTGAIKRDRQRRRCRIENESFNSKLVRLKDTIPSCAQAQRFVFQFQTGAIKRGCADVKMP